MSESLVNYQCVDDVAILRLNDPGALNAFSDAMCELLIERLLRAAREARVIVLTGNGRGFSSGVNLNVSPADKPASERDAGERLERLFNPLMTVIRNLAVPFVTAVNGPAAGVGCSVALSGDLVVAAQSAYFLQAFSRIGLVPDGGSAYLLAKSAGRVRAMEAMLLAEKISASQALEWGIINRVASDGKALDMAMDFALRLAAGPTHALGLVRRVAWSALEEGFADQLALERRVQREAGRSPDFVEGVAAFREKRAPRFRGVIPLDK
ncbi:2-(1,2-epoxy-1,2-dihydrophenyl)acetyl-CoA isomerase [Paraburkholderia sp. GAS448]|uniref:enoyl-CoA hydratase-related protein n=1 Tax=Paraburkholderia sp. GAS448 TaxID=3035136 RepID=UPI003D1DBE56